MRNGLKWLSGFLGVLMLAGTSHEQALTRTVKVEEADDGRMHWLQPKVNQQVIDAFAAKVASSSRYTLAQYNITQAEPELLVVIVCQESKTGNTAGFCTYKFEYRPKRIPEFNVPLGEPKVMARPDAAAIAEDIFEEFVKETTETRLSVAETEVNLRVANFCSKPENQLPCSGKFQ